MKAGWYWNNDQTLIEIKEGETGFHESYFLARCSDKLQALLYEEQALHTTKQPHITENS